MKRTATISKPSAVRAKPTAVSASCLSQKRSGDTHMRKRSSAYTIQSDAERREVEWLISEGDVPSIEHYERTMTKLMKAKKHG